MAVFIIPALEVGLISYMLEARKTNNYDISNIFNVFKSNDYLNVVKVMFLRNLYIFFWSLLLVVPGFIKSYEYRFMPYLLAENMNLESEEAFSLSKKYSTGKKMDMFVLDLSFIGWYLLGALLFGLGVILVAPYHNATNMELFALLSKRDSNEAI